MHDPNRTVAVICGASSWPRLDRFTAATAFSRTAKGLTNYLTGKDGLGLSEENVLDLFDSDSTAVEHFDRIKTFLELHMRRTRSRHGKGMLVLVAYIGHGAFFEAQRFYCLLLRDTHEPAPVETSLRVQALARTLKHTAPKSSRIVILDSCFAAHAVNDFQSEVQQVASAKAQEAVDYELDAVHQDDVLDDTFEEVTTLEAGGGSGRVALLCASSSKDPAQLASHDSFTLFGQALLDVLHYGDPRQPGAMSLRQVSRLITGRLRQVRDAPRPQVHSPEQDGRDLADEPLFPNPAQESPPRMRITRPRRTKRLLGALATTVAVVCAAVAVVLVYPDRDNECGTDLATVVLDGDECIGLTDGSYNFFRPPARDQVVQDQIQLVLDTLEDQNDWTADLHEQHPERPYFTLVNLQALTAPKHGSGTAADLTAERESLEGLVVAQRKQIDAVGPDEPLIRILIGNAGRGTAKGPKLAEQIIEAARNDPSLVGVVGFNMSNQATQDTVDVLARHGIPIVATTLSLDSLADRNPLFIQVAPQNRREAATAAGFAANSLTTAKRVRIYTSADEKDLYSANLRDDLRYWFEQFGFGVEEISFTPSGLPAQEAKADGGRAFGSAFEAGTDICTGDGVAFFSGRGVPDFGEFLRGAATCEHLDTTIIGADDVTKHVADPVARSREAIAGVPYYFISFAPAPITDSEPAAIATRFYDSLRQRFFFEQQPESERSLDGHAALSYDGAQVYLTAVRELNRTAPGQPRLAAVTAQISELGALPGVTGTFHYGVPPRPNVPKDKPVTVLRVENGEVVRQILAYCGDYPDRPTAAAPWCPAAADEQPAGR